MMPLDSEFSSPESQVRVRVRSRRSNRGNQLFNNNDDASIANDNSNANNETSLAGLGEEDSNLLLWIMATTLSCHF